MNINRLLLEHIKVGVVLLLFTPLLVGPIGVAFGEYPKALFFRVVVEILLIFYLILVLQKPEHLPRNTLLLWAVMGFVGAVFLSSIMGIHFERSFLGDFDRSEGALLYLHLLAFFVIVAGIFKKYKEWLGLFRWVVAISVLPAIVGFLQKFNIVDLYTISGSYPAGTFTNTAFYASYLIFIIFLSLFLFFAESGWKWKVLWGIIFVANSILLAFSFSLGALAGVGAGVAVLLFIKGEKFRWALYALFLCVALAFLLLPQREILGDIINSLETRIPVWKIALHIWQERPFLGGGQESFSYLFELERTDTTVPVSAFFDRPHNKFLEVLVHNGAIGFFFYAAIFGICWYYLFRVPKETLSLMARRIFIALLFAYAVSLFFLFDTISTFVLFFLLLASLNETVVRPLVFPAILKKLPRLSLIPIIISVIVLSVGALYFVNLKPLRANLLIVQGSRFEPGDLANAFIRYQKAIDQKTLYTADFQVFTAERLLTYADAGLAMQTQYQILGVLADSIAPALEKKIQKPDKIHRIYYVLLGGIKDKQYRMSKDRRFLDEFEKISREAVDMYPLRPQFHMLLGRALILEGKYEEGYASFEKGFLFSNDQTLVGRANWYRKLGGIYLEVGEKEKAGSYFKRAWGIYYLWVKINPEKKNETLGIIGTAFADQVALFHYKELNDIATAKKIYEQAIETYSSKQAEWFQSRYEALLKQCCG